MPYKPTGKPRGRPKKAKPIIAPADPATVDPRAVLAEIAADREAPAGARVQAAKALMSAAPPPADGEGAPVDELTRRALDIMNRTGRPN